MKKSCVFIALFAVSTVGCQSDGDREIELGPAGDIAGLVGASAQRGGEPPEVLAGSSPGLSRDVTEALQESDRGFAATIRVLIGHDGNVIGVKVLETPPEDSPVARQYAEEVSESVWRWRYKAARQDGSPVRSYLDLSFRHGGNDASASGLKPVSSESP